MKKKAFKLALAIAAFFLVIALLNSTVVTRQGINFEVHTIELPLYLKILDFFDRHYNYRTLVKRIVGKTNTNEEKVSRIFAWTYKQIKPQPENLPVIDDHVWNIIIRGYGVEDQSSDVFTTLCNYAGIDAFYDLIFTQDRNFCIPLSFVRIGNKWVTLDPHNGVYFQNRQGNMAGIEEILKGDWVENYIDTPLEGHNFAGKKSYVNYAVYLKNLSPVTAIGLKRANIQSPLKRLQYEITKLMRRI